MYPSVCYPSYGTLFNLCLYLDIVASVDLFMFELMYSSPRGPWLAIWSLYDFYLCLELCFDIFSWVPDLDRTCLRVWLVYNWIGIVAKDKPGQILIWRKTLPRTHGNYRQASFHHAHMIRVRYFHNLICGWNSAWVLPFLGQASHLWLTPIASIRNYKRSMKVNLTIGWNSGSKSAPYEATHKLGFKLLSL